MCATEEMRKPSALAAAVALLTCDDGVPVGHVVARLRQHRPPAPRRRGHRRQRPLPRPARPCPHAPTPPPRPPDAGPIHYRPARPRSAALRLDCG